MIQKNVCTDLIQEAMILNYSAIVSVKENHYKVHFWCNSKDEAINELKNANLTYKVKYYQI